MRRVVVWLAALGALALLGGCAQGVESGLGYYRQSLAGHWAVMRAARPVQDWLDDPATPAALRTRLARAQAMRDFAVAELALPDNPSYRRYAHLDRTAVVWNVVAAPPLALTLRTWCFPVAGCVGYRGYYDEREARAFAAGLDEGWEVMVYPVPAYSTLGWLNWAGGDPLLSTFIGYPEGELARLIFHELAHQVVYVRDDTAFNEGFATAVERLGGQRWLAQQATEAERQAYVAFDARRQAFRALTRGVREELQQVFNDPTLGQDAKLVRKAEVMVRFRDRYAALKASWSGHGGYDAWVARANNAAFAAQAAYQDWVPAFEALFERENQDFARFYDAVRALAQQPRATRDATLRALREARPD